MPFNGKVTRIESLQVSAEGSHLICVAKTLDQAFDSYKYHLVIFDLATYMVSCHSVIPRVDQRWDHPQKETIGNVVKVVDEVVETGVSHIWMVVNE